MKLDEKFRRELEEHTVRVLDSLRDIPRLILQLENGIGADRQYSFDEIATATGLTPEEVEFVSIGAYRKLREPLAEQPQQETLPEQPIASVRDAIEQVKALTPELIGHLKSESPDFHRLPWNVFEHLVAEFLAASPTFARLTG